MSNISRLTDAKESFDLGGIRMKKRFLITVLGLTMGSALLFSACGSKKETAETTAQTVAESTTAKSEEKTTATEAPAPKVDINFEIANHLEMSYADIGNAFGEATSDEVNSEKGERTVKYANPDRELHYYDDKSEGYTLFGVSAKAGDILSFEKDSVKLSDILDQMEGEEGKGLESNEAFLTVGEKGDHTVVFLSEGYYFVLSVDKDDMVSKDSAAAILTEDVVGIDTSETETKAPSEIKIPETTAAKQ